MSTFSEQTQRNIKSKQSVGVYYKVFLKILNYCIQSEIHNNKKEMSRVTIERDKEINKAKEKRGPIVALRYGTEPDTEANTKILAIQ